jgi:hypothetical protein
MPSTLKQVLMIFEDASRPLSLLEMAQQLAIEQDTLENMIEYWVRRGRLREAGNPASQCTSCGGKDSCPFVVKLPRRYELATGADLPPCRTDKPSCCCE